MDLQLRGTQMAHAGGRASRFSRRHLEFLSPLSKAQAFAGQIRVFEWGRGSVCRQQGAFFTF